MTPTFQTRFDTVLRLLRGELTMQSAASLVGVDVETIERWRRAFLEGARQGLGGPASPPSKHATSPHDLDQSDVQALVEAAVETAEGHGPYFIATVVFALLTTGSFLIFIPVFTTTMAPRWLLWVIGATCGVSLIANIVLTRMNHRAVSRRNRYHIEREEPAKATIVAMKTTGVRINKQPYGAASPSSVYRVLRAAGRLGLPGSKPHCVGVALGACPGRSPLRWGSPGGLPGSKPIALG